MSLGSLPVCRVELLPQNRDYVIVVRVGIVNQSLEAGFQRAVIGNRDLGFQFVHAFKDLRIGIRALTSHTFQSVADSSQCDSLVGKLTPQLTSRLTSERFPRSFQYNPDWILAGVSGGANPLWMSEWLTAAMDLRPGMRVLDLGCGRALSSIFLRREFGVQVWAADLWFSPGENIQRIRDAGVEDGVFALHADARSLPFAPEFFDAIVSIDSFCYYGTDDLYLNYLARFVKPGGQIAIAGAGLVREVDGMVPAHLQDWWSQEVWGLHAAEWWRRHWERTGIVDIEVADTLPDGWRLWLDWHRLIAPDNEEEIKALEADAGRNLGYVRVVARRRGDTKLEDPIVAVPAQYRKEPLLRPLP